MSKSLLHKSKRNRNTQDRPPLSYQELERIEAHDIIAISSGKSDTDSDIVMVSSSSRPSGSSKNTTPARARRISPAKKREQEEEIPEEFREMLAESYKEKPEMFRKKPSSSKAAASVPSSSKVEAGPSTTKKRKREALEVDTSDQSDGGSLASGKAAGKPHIIQDSSADEGMADLESKQMESDDEDDEDEFEDVDWENVDLAKADLPDPSAPLVLNLSKTSAAKPRRPQKRAPPTSVERKIRLEIHKLHLLCLLSHVYARSNFCNDHEVQNHLTPLLDSRKKKDLMDQTHGGRVSVFRAGLKAAAHDFRKKFNITRPGIRKPLWHEGKDEIPYPSYGDRAIQLPEFLEAAEKLEGSRDLGAQLFCAMLRGLGLSARLVVSLQVLSYTYKSAYVSTIKRQGSLTMAALESPTTEFAAISDDEDDSSNEDGDIDMSMRDTKYGGPGHIRPYTNFRTTITPTKKPANQAPKKVAPKKSVIRDPRLPVYWVEAFDVGRQEWVPVDPMVTEGVGHPLLFEPPQSEAHENEMSYVVAFEAEGQAKDVTRRYVKSYNGKTRTLRVEATQDGTRWWGRALRRYRRGYNLDRDQIEEAALSEREVSEGIPKNIEAFKAHPHFAIERHLRRNEVITPKRQVSTIYGKDKQPIQVYRRQDVKIVKTARQWYSLGRELKVGEQPVKTWKRSTRPRRERGSSFEGESDGDEQSEEGMYTEAQTTLYVPPPVVFGIIPKNAYGNLDVFVESMVPEGAVHLPNKMMVKAAKLLGVDFAEAVTGFEFKGRASTAVIKGIVAAEEHREALEATVQGIQEEIDEELADKQQFEMLKLWRKFLVGLRIRERLDDYGPVEDEHVERRRKKEGKERVISVEEYAEADGGGFAREETDEGAGFMLKEAVDDEGRGFMSDEAVDDEDAKADGGGFTREATHEGGGFMSEEAVDGEGGGFMPDEVVDDEGAAGGFMPEDAVMAEPEGDGEDGDDDEMEDEDYDFEYDSD